MLTLFKIEDRNKIQEREIVVDFINENVDELANYTIVEPGSGIHHFYVPWYVPGFYMFFRKFLEPDHPIVLFLMKWFSNNIIDRKGWSSDIHNKKYIRGNCVISFMYKFLEYGLSKKIN